MRGEVRTRRSRRSRTLLPLHARTRPSHTISCWYCDFKVSACNGFLFLFANRHARFLRVWFSIGTGFSFVALAIATMVLLQELAWALGLYSQKRGIQNLLLEWLFGVSSLVSTFSISLMDAGIMTFSTLVSVLVHELGHAVAAASQGVQIEYFAVFLAVIFPGALVAFNPDLLQSLPQAAALRIYCAGIWHNMVFCAACTFALFIMPAILYPFYVHGERPMVLSVSTSSSLSGYLSRGDVILTLDGSDIHSPQEWNEKLIDLANDVSNQHYYARSPKIHRTITGEKGYCIPSAWVEQREFQLMDNETSCPEDLSAFLRTSCCVSSLQDGDACDDSCGNTTRMSHCFNPKDVIKLKKCGGWQMMQTTRGCRCSQDECCLTPVQSGGNIWVEISFLRPLSVKCLKSKRNLTTVGSQNFSSDSATCLETFVFIGDVVSMLDSIELSAYQPRSPSRSFIIYLPSFLEKVLMYTLRISASLALLNSMPVFLLDGESILEISLDYMPWIDPRLRRKVLRLILCGGTLLCIVAFLRTFSYLFM